MGFQPAWALMPAHTGPTTHTMTKTFRKTAPAATVETVVAPLSRGQKAAATRKANAEKAKAAHAKKVAGVKLSTAAKVPSAKDRAKNLSALMREQKARNKRKLALAKERAKHAAEKSADKAATDKRVKGVAAIRKAGQGNIGLLRHSAVLAATRGKRSAYDYAAGLNAAFTPDWVNFKRSDANKETNHGIMVGAYFDEQTAFYADFRANFDGVGDCNPSATWANLKKYSRNLVANGAPTPRGQGSKVTVEQAARRDVKKLYLRVNNSPDFDGSEKLQTAAHKLGEVLALLGVNLTAVNAKISPKDK